MALLDEDRQIVPVKLARLARLRALSSLWRSALLSEYFVLYLSIIFFLILWPFIPDIATIDNLGNLLSNMGPLLTVAVGQTFVLIVAGIDLSQPSTMGVTSVLGAMIMTSTLKPTRYSKSPFWGILLSAHGSPLSGSAWAIPVAIISMLLVGALIGLINGTAVARFRMPPFMVTLVTMTFFQALAIWLTKSENIFFLPAGFTTIGSDGIFFVQYVILIALGLAIIAHLVLSRTMLGHWFYAVGMNMRTATISGVPTQRTIVLAYVFSGFCAALASVLYTSRLATGSPTLGQDILLDVIGATVVGGTSLFGGKGKIIWTVFGVLFFILLDNSLDLLNLSFYTVTAVKGAVIVFAALLNVVRMRILERQ